MIFIKDDEFIRGDCPMTKEDVRILTIGKLNLKEDSIVLDIGSGTGSITVQASNVVENGKIYSVEKNYEAYQTTLSNLEKFKCSNVETYFGDALEFLDYADKIGIKFDSIFIGGSGGNLKEVIEKSLKCLNESGTLAMNFITLNNAYIAIETLREHGKSTDITLINISKNRKNTYMMMANNPIYIIQSLNGGK